jgi:hypothetical protein
MLLLKNTWLRKQAESKDIIEASTRRTINERKDSKREREIESLVFLS